nr:hypothetical protein [Tanacetum cinerariifolium]
KGGIAREAYRGPKRELVRIGREHHRGRRYGRAVVKERAVGGGLHRVGGDGAGRVAGGLRRSKAGVESHGGVSGAGARGYFLVGNGVGRGRGGDGHDARKLRRAQAGRRGRGRELRPARCQRGALRSREAGEREARRKRHSRAAALR